MHKYHRESCVVQLTLTSSPEMLNGIRQLWNRDNPSESAPIPPPLADGLAEGQPDTPCGDFAIDDYRPIKVIVIGAGMCGILAGIRWETFDVGLS